MGAGLRAKTSRRLAAMWPDRSTRISMRSASMRSATGIIAHRDDVSPVIKSASETRGGRVLRVHVGIGKEFEIGFLVVPHQRLEEIVDRVIAKIAGDISDPKPPIWIGHIGELAAAQQR